MKHPVAVGDLIKMENVAPQICRLPQHVGEPLLSGGGTAPLHDPHGNAGTRAVEAEAEEHSVAVVERDQIPGRASGEAPLTMLDHTQG
ncbi:MAG: hypothetical protein R3F31_08565 [Verrucomicrobiales bacterium]